MMCDLNKMCYFRVDEETHKMYIMLKKDLNLNNVFRDFIKLLSVRNEELKEIIKITEEEVDGCIIDGAS